MSSSIRCKCVFLGNAGAGKTTLIVKHINNVFDESVPFTLDNSRANFVVGSKPVFMTIWDTPEIVDGEGFHQYESLVFYPHTDVFVVCFSVVNRLSFEHVKTRWSPEANHRCPKTPVILVGTKVDLRNECDNTHITRREGEALARETHAEAYIECSSLTGEGVDEVFLKAAQAALFKLNKTNSRCILL